MACGKPVVACKGGGPEETIIDGVTGHLVNPEIDEVANAMTELMENEEGRSSMGKNAREHVKVNYAWDRTVEGILNALT
jgi:alpha-1,3/alpha-1,6-mannosyltransferase